MAVVNLAPPPVPGLSANCITGDGQTIYAMGETGTGRLKFYAYAIFSDSWVKLADPPTPLLESSAPSTRFLITWARIPLPSPKEYVIFLPRVDGSASLTGVYDEMYLYDISADSWSGRITGNIEGEYIVNGQILQFSGLPEFTAGTTSSLCKAWEAEYDLLNKSITMLTCIEHDSTNVNDGTPRAIYPKMLVGSTLTFGAEAWSYTYGSPRVDNGKGFNGPFGSYQTSIDTIRLWPAKMGTNNGIRVFQEFMTDTSSSESVRFVSRAKAVDESDTTASGLLTWLSGISTPKDNNRNYVITDTRFLDDTVNSGARAITFRHGENIRYSFCDYMVTVNLQQQPIDATGLYDADDINTDENPIQFSAPVYYPVFSYFDSRLYSFGEQSATTWRYEQLSLPSIGAQISIDSSVSFSPAVTVSSSYNLNVDTGVSFSAQISESSSAGETINTSASFSGDVSASGGGSIESTLPSDVSMSPSLNVAASGLGRSFDDLASEVRKKILDEKVV